MLCAELGRRGSQIMLLSMGRLPDDAQRAEADAIPNLRLVLMEDTARNNTREPRFRVSGVVTEYRGRNYLLLDKVTVMSQATQQYR